MSGSLKYNAGSRKFVPESGRRACKLMDRREFQQPVQGYNSIMKLAASCLLFASMLRAQAITGDSVIYRLDSALQAIDAEKGREPISMVIAVQANYKIQAAMMINIRRIASMLEPLVSSESGEIEVVSFGDRVRVLVAQPFTSISMKVADAMAHLKISTGLQSSTSTMSDAIAQATSDLETRPPNGRRIILMVGENSTDSESEGKLKDAINRAADQLPNVVVLFPLLPR